MGSLFSKCGGVRLRGQGPLWRAGVRCAVVGGAIVWCLLPFSLAAQEPSPTDEVRALSARASDRIRALQREADRLASQERTVFGDLRRLEIARAIAREKAAQADADLAAVSTLHDAAATRLSTLEATRVAETPGVTERLVALYKRGHVGYAQLLLASDDVRAFGRMSRGVAAVAELDRARLDAHRRTLAAERDALADLDTKRTAVAALQKASARARTDVDTAMAARGRLIDDLDRRRDLAAQFVAELQAAQVQLERTVASVDTGAAAPALPFRPFRGDLDWPVTGRVTNEFGRAPAGRFGTTIVRNGIEVAAAEGTSVHAIHEGTVAYAAPFAGFGVLVIVDHGGSAFSMYGQLSDTGLAAGARVRQGDAVGRVGLAPAGDAALYFELRIDGRPVDPLQWLRRLR